MRGAVVEGIFNRRILAIADVIPLFFTYILACDDNAIRKHIMFTNLLVVSLGERFGEALVIFGRDKKRGQIYV